MDFQDWESTRATFRQRLESKFPSDWDAPTIPAPQKSLQVDALSVFRSSGFLTARELELTETEDATALIARIHSGQWSAEEVTRAFCKRATLAQRLVNCLMDVNFENALSRAKELDTIFKKSGRVVGPLHGLPISIKDLTKAKGFEHSFGFTAWAGNVDDEDALVVKALKEAGAIIYVKTTMPQTGMALETVSNLWGRTLNPYNTRLSAGGSSGGEGALGACRGAPIGIATDIGGSIRAPAAFNGLYGIRPSSRRFSYAGNVVSLRGQIAISATVGPVGQSLRDLSLICQTLSAAEMWHDDTVVPPLPWKLAAVPDKLTIGIMMWDEVVMPHPPMRRAVKDAVEKLKKAGHEVIDFKPYKHAHAWEITRAIYFPTAGREIKEILNSGGDTLIPAAAKLLEGMKELTVPELMHYHREQKQYQMEYSKHWSSFKSLELPERIVDAVLMPSMASCSFPHDFFPWWGYLSTWNLLDYPSVILPVSKVEPTDVKDLTYEPINDWDKQNHDLYDLDLFAGAPVSLQLVGRTFREEKLLAVATAVDKAIQTKI